MPVVNVQGQNSIIEQSPPAIITDGEISTTNRDRLLATAAFTPALKHIKKMSGHYDAMRQTKRDRIDAAQKRKGDALFHRNLDAAEYAKTGKKLTANVTAEDDATIHEADQEITEESKRKIPVVDIDTVMQQAPRYRNWLPHDKKYFEGDTRHADDIRRDVKKNRIAAEGKLDIATQSPRKVEDALRSGMASLRSHAEKGKPITSGLLQGYTVDNRGEFQRNLHPSITFPEDWSKPTQFSDDLALVDNALDVSIWANFDSYVAAMTKQVMEEATDDANAISDAERPQMIAAAKAELLAAQHAEESANVMCELAGIPVFRPYDWPVIVLLQVEAPPKAKNVSRAPVVPAPVKDADLEFEDADAGDDE